MADAASRQTNPLGENHNKSDEVDGQQFPVDENQAIDTEVVNNTEGPSGLQRQQVSLVLQAGPLPPAEELAKYNLIIPNGADRIMAMAEKEQIHRHEMESIDIKSAPSQIKRGQLSALSIVMGSLVLTGYLFYLGKDGYAIGVISWNFILIAAAFINVRLGRSEDEDQE
jgi:uncharacterized membrane protein